MANPKVTGLLQSIEADIEDLLGEADHIMWFLEDLQFDIEGKLLDEERPVLRWVLERLQRRSL